MDLRANCKINIGLDVLRRRDDGFHELQTLMYPVRGLYDEISVEQIAGSAVQFRGLGMVVDCPAEQNLCVRAAQLMRDNFDLPAVEITLRKVVPFGAGLGGGSSDAVSVLLAMNEIFSLSLSEEELIRLAAILGSDTAFFVRNRSQLCSGRGEILQDYNLDLQGYALVLVKPEGVNVSTREAYGSIVPSVPQTPLAERLMQPISTWQANIKNDFEKHIFQFHPSLAKIKQDLIDAGALYASMSGSGSSIFGLFPGGEPSPLDTKKGEQLKVYSPYILEL